MQETYNVGIYCRLSREDERTGESVSVENQREMLSRYVLEQGWNLYAAYCEMGSQVRPSIGLGSTSLSPTPPPEKSIWYSVRTSVVSAEIISKAGSIRTSFFRASAAGSSPSMMGWTPLTKTMRCW